MSVPTEDRTMRACPICGRMTTMTEDECRNGHAIFEEKFRRTTGAGA